MASKKLYCLTTEAHVWPDVIMQSCLNEYLNSRPHDVMSSVLTIMPPHHIAFLTIISAVKKIIGILEPQDCLVGCLLNVPFNTL